MCDFDGAAVSRVSAGGVLRARRDRLLAKKKFQIEWLAEHGQFRRPRKLTLRRQGWSAVGRKRGIEHDKAPTRGQLKGARLEAVQQRHMVSDLKSRKVDAIWFPSRSRNGSKSKRRGSIPVAPLASKLFSRSEQNFTHHEQNPARMKEIV